MGRRPVSKKAQDSQNQDSVIPSLEAVILVYVVFVLFGAYITYMYYPLTVRHLFNALFAGWV
jgi:hypothetical protein